MTTPQREELENREWKERVGVSAPGVHVESAGDIVLHKEFPASFTKSDKDDQPDTRLVDFVLNTGGADRAADTIKGEGWELDNYKSNPVVLWHHNSSAFAGPAPMPHAGLPVARGENLEVIGDALIGAADFYHEEGDDPSEAAKFIETIYQMVKGGFLNAVSVGFIPLEWTYDEERKGYNFLRQELLEFSVVPIPADSGALRRAAESGVDIQPIYQWAVELLESGDEIPVHRTRLEAVAKGLGLGRGARFFDLSSSEIKSSVKQRLKVDPEELAAMEKKLEETQKVFEEQNVQFANALLQVEHLESVVEGIAEGVAEELAADEAEATVEDAALVGTVSELVKEVCEKEDQLWTDPVLSEPVAVEDIVAVRQEEAPVGRDNAIVLRIVDDEEEVDAEGEEAFRFDPEALKQAVSKAVGKEFREIKRLFTMATGRVVD